MYAVTLITSPVAPSLDAALIDGLRRDWGGGDVTWPAPQEAAVFEITTRPENQWSVWEELQRSGVDLVIQPAAGRRKRMLLADMDSTMIQQECIDELAAEAGFGDRVAAITARAMNGELDFEDAIIERVGLLQGLPEDVIGQVLQNRITYMPGGKVLLKTMKAHGAYVALVSGGFTAFTAQVAAELGFDEHRANTLIAADGKLTGQVGRPIMGQAAKVDALQQITSARGITPADVIAVGDGANDLGMLSLVGTGVALHAKPAVQAQCDVRVNHGDLTALLYLQGYGRDGFVT
ncbi:MAG: phosphoserine phosphatase SerB [Pseudomonadota bacterium]